MNRKWKNIEIEHSNMNTLVEGCLGLVCRSGCFGEESVRICGRRAEHKTWPKPQVAEHTRVVQETAENVPNIGIQPAALFNTTRHSSSSPLDSRFFVIFNKTKNLLRFFYFSTHTPEPARLFNVLEKISVWRWRKSVVVMKRDDIMFRNVVLARRLLFSAARRKGRFAKKFERKL